MAKLEAYGLDTKALKRMLSYLHGRKQYVKIRNSWSPSQVNSVWRSTGINSWTNIIQHFHERHIFLLGSGLHNVADDNTTTTVAETIQGLVNSLEVKTSNAIEWMKDNDMTANPDKFKAIVVIPRRKLKLNRKCFQGSPHLL